MPSVITPHRAVILSGVRLVCEGLSQRLESNPVISVAGAALDGADACEYVRRFQSDVVLMDASSREFLPLVPALRTAGAVHIIAFAASEHEADVVACAQAGVSALVERKASVDDLVDAVRACSRGELALSPRLTAQLFHRVGTLSRDLPTQCNVGLTTREAEIWSLIRLGLSNKEIAARLRLRLPTVKNHVHRLLDKLGVHRRAEAAVLGVRST